MERKKKERQKKKKEKGFSFFGSGIVTVGKSRGRGGMRGQRAKS
jgi:hypothetical protein